MVFHACFEKLIVEFPLAAKLLGRIKTEYDLNIRHGDAAVEKLGAMQTKAAANEDRIRVLERKLEGLARHLASEVKPTRQLRAQLDQVQQGVPPAAHGTDQGVPDDVHSDVDSLAGAHSDGGDVNDHGPVGKAEKRVTLQTPDSKADDSSTTNANNNNTNNATPQQQSTPNKVAHTISDYDEVDSGLDLTNGM
eukprot:TRINITY_DN3557_c0_g1_i1.p1 TRINITY_DN3557_c0_g1~~TRINITY_DN3557_c0_g1_i1.p1  ORF type:complete len:203 (-),score=45.92 TRINITY_DN3557_c0_g1_i1:642-1220(-)